MKQFLPLLLSFFVLLPFTQLHAQVTVSPGFPSAEQEITIRYDARQGTSNLVGESPVYIHIGAVTAGPNSSTWANVPFTWGTADPNAEMRRVSGETDVWEWTFRPRDLFTVSSETPIFRVGMVFRNAAGTREGKSETNSDIFINLSQGFQVIFASPTPNQLLTVGESVDILLQSPEEATLKLFQDGSQVAQASDATSLAYRFTAEAEGTVLFRATAEANGQSSESELRINVAGPSPVLPLPQGAKKGINYLSDTEVLLVLEAPKKKNVYVIGDFNDWQVLPDFQMAVDPTGELFWLKITGLEPAKPYIFQYLVDGQIRIGDPYADMTSDPFHDQEIINENRHPGVQPFPEGKTSFQATYLQTAQTPYEWKYTTYKKPKTEELIIYELLVRDFDDRRTYEAVIERLDYLKELGINAIELMPIKEFEGNISWGYNPSFFFATDKYYGTKNDLKRLIDEAHKRDMVVLLDMVLNHAFGQSPFVRLYNDGDFGAPTLDNPWLNRVAKHPFNVGYDFNHESPYTQAFVDSVNHYWLSEYRFDGYRYDLSKGFTQVNSGDDVGFWSQRDESRIRIWKNIYDTVKKDFPDSYLILEHFADNSEERELADYGLLFWGNMNFDFREMAKGNARNFDYGYFKTRGWAKNNLVSYMESHDEERTMWESLINGRTSPINIRELNNAVNRNQLLAAFFFAIPGPKMLWQFEEFGYDLELNNDRLGIKPTRWEYLDDPERQRLFFLYQEMMRLKNDYNFFNQPEDVQLALSGSSIKHITIRDEETDIVLYGNFSLTAANTVTVTFPYDGTWYNHFTGEAVTVTGGTRTIRLRPSEFILYTSTPLPTPQESILMTDVITSIENQEVDQTGFKLYPVPATTVLNVTLPETMQAFTYRVIDVTGKVMNEGHFVNQGDNLAIDVREFQSGLYIFEIFDTRGIHRKRFLKK